MLTKNTATLPKGWSESRPGALATNPDPALGGIIDRQIVSGEWFIIFNNRAIPDVEGLPSRDQAFATFQASMAAAGLTV